MSGDRVKDRATSSVTPRYEEARALDIWDDGDAGFAARLTYDMDDGWTEIYEVAEVDGALVVVGVEVRPRGSVPPRGLTSRRLHRLKAGQALVDAEREARQMDRRPAFVPLSRTPTQGRQTGVTSERARILERVARLLDEARARGERHHAKWIHAQLIREGIHRNPGTVRNDIVAVKRAKRAGGKTDELPQAIAAGDRALERLRWDLGSVDREETTG
jgi:hypothetical protein